MTDITQSLKFANLMCSRLCHDLISPVGTVNSVLELLEDEDSSVDAEILALVSRSAAESTAKLAFFRTAFGDNGGDQAELSCDQLHSLSEGVIPAGKISLHWDTGDMDSIKNYPGKLVLMFVITAIEALPRGGAISVRVQSLDDGLGIACLAEGPGANLKDNISSALSGDEEASGLSARNITACYARYIAASMGAAVETSSDEGAVMLAVLLP